MAKQVSQDTSLPVSKLVCLLFEHRRQPDGTPYTDRDVAYATGMSQSAISAIRRGIIQNPRIDNIKALCRFFKVGLSYFDAESDAEAMELMVADQEDAGADLKLAMRLNRLSDDARRDLDRIITYVLRADISTHNTLHSDDKPQI